MAFIIPLKRIVLRLARPNLPRS